MILQYVIGVNIISHDGYLVNDFAPNLHKKRRRSLAGVSIVLFTVFACVHDVVTLYQHKQQAHGGAHHHREP